MKLKELSIGQFTVSVVVITMLLVGFDYPCLEAETIREIGMVGWVVVLALSFRCARKRRAKS